MVVEAELHKTSLEPPPKGKQSFLDIDLVKRVSDDDDHDDDYFHLTCHVDKNLKSRIELGEFIELEKLLPKHKTKVSGADDNHLEWVTHNGMTYLAPAQDRDNQITGIRRWEQAFRIYAAIYCAANPTRSAEIWQYIHTINSAASSFQWDNVQYYDTVFRQMMSERPGRSWSKTYAQLWQLALRDPIQRNANQNNSYFGTKSGNNRDNALAFSKRTEGLVR